MPWEINGTPFDEEPPILGTGKSGEKAPTLNIPRVFGIAVGLSAAWGWLNTNFPGLIEAVEKLLPQLLELMK